jgi:hypothetical protein
VTGAFAEDTRIGAAYTLNVPIAKAPDRELAGQGQASIHRPAGDETYLDEPYLTIRWRSIPQILYAEWTGFATSTQMRAALMTGIRAIRERHVTGYVSDTRKVKGILPDDERWAREVWLPQAVAAGLKRMAIVTATAGLSKMAYDDAATDMDSQGLSMRTFDSVAAATTWALTGLRGI